MDLMELELHFDTKFVNDHSPDIWQRIYLIEILGAIQRKHK